MQIVQKTKHILCILLITVLCFGMLSAIAAPAQAAEILPQELYMEQSRPGICTMASAAMLLRSALYLYGNSHWSDLSESDAAAFCWIYGLGLKYDWSFETDYASITVAHTPLSGISAADLKALLDEHPEGIEFYCGGVPHAVLLTDYEDDTFYCVDPAPYCSGRRVPLADSWLGYRLGDQDSVLRNATAYWSITDMTIDADLDEVPIDEIIAEQNAELVRTQAKQLASSDHAWISPAIYALSD